MDWKRGRKRGVREDLKCKRIKCVQKILFWERRETFINKGYEPYKNELETIKEYLEEKREVNWILFPEGSTE